jgi:hypothetical protein
VDRLAAACPDGIEVYFENGGGAIWQAVMPLLSGFARVPVCGVIARSSAMGQAEGANLLPATMREVLSKSLTLRGFINYEFAGESATFRLLRSCASLGLLTYDGESRFAATPLLDTLRKDNPQSLRGAALALPAPGHWLTWGRFADLLRQSGPKGFVTSAGFTCQ